jgi:formylglycine-generating enzyme required for sulfatase activity
MLLLLAGVLYRQGPRRVDRLFATLLDQLGDQAALAERARCAAILGAAVQDLAPVKYQPGDVRYHELLDAVFGIFDPAVSADVPVRDRIQAADALGRAGDPRFVGAAREKNWIPIPAGEFRMGSQKDDPHAPNYDEQMYDEDEGPVHTVRLDAYEMARYPVTVGEYAHFVDQDGYRQRQWWEAGGFGQWESPDNWEDQLQHPNRPVVYVSWYEAAAYAAWAECRLPTEAQWERAARGTKGRRYPWGKEDPDDLRLNYAGKIGHPTPVGIYPRGNTPEGICDLAGNVWEWCWDTWDEKYYHHSPHENPSGPETGSSRVLRGGDWRHLARYCRSAARDGDDAGNRNDNYGFRLVRYCG